MNYVVHIYSRSILKVIGKRIPHEMIFGEPPQNNKDKISGCAAFTHVHKDSRNSKLRYRARIGVFYILDNGPHEIYLIRSLAINSARHVAFKERTLPLKMKSEVAEIDDKYAKEKVCRKEVLRIKFITN